MNPYDPGTAARSDARRWTPARQLQRNALRYVVICLFLAAVNVCVTPHVWWVLWIVAGWGVTLLLEGIDYLCFTNNECHERSKTE